MTHERIRGLALIIGLALIVGLGFQAATATAERNNLRADLARTLEHERACILTLANNHIPVP